MSSYRKEFSKGDKNPIRLPHGLMLMRAVMPSSVPHTIVVFKCYHRIFVIFLGSYNKKGFFAICFLSLHHHFIDRLAPKIYT